MEVEKIRGMDASKNDDDDDVPLPGFRFHPTDDELVGFYLRRKVEKRPISIELIKQIDIYKYDPWDLPKGSNVGDKEWYFFCKRGRKYRNSVRPNRVTGSGFWKATGIDRPVYSGGGEGRECIGLKKSLVYYCGSAGKGTKTDWMMHEFRLPPADLRKTEQEAFGLFVEFSSEMYHTESVYQIGENYLPKRNTVDSSSKTCSTVESDNGEGYISFRADPEILQNETKPSVDHVNIEMNQFMLSSQLISSITEDPSTASYSSFWSRDMNELLKYGDWDELRRVVEFPVNPFLL
ncbi:hypothetical protein F0562_008602 [Nyssa sinensis]|uniref:NAC domain-containing protein n=1 Tax=Nyssa sinensis TaxID=561372 RepID=A0A5J5AA53_9ASTE|nr:hypothetical protein F0562_008602 [Nyssa sinensis]